MKSPCENCSDLETMLLGARARATDAFYTPRGKSAADFEKKNREFRARFLLALAAYIAVRGNGMQYKIVLHAEMARGALI